VVVFPTALLLAFGLLMSLRGKGTPLCAFLAFTLGVVIANSTIGTTIVEIVNQALETVSSTGTALAPR
jgi:hypothetical protein